MHQPASMQIFTHLTKEFFLSPCQQGAVDIALLEVFPIQTHRKFGHLICWKAAVGVFEPAERPNRISCAVLCACE